MKEALKALGEDEEDEKDDDEPMSQPKLDTTKELKKIQQKEQARVE